MVVTKTIQNMVVRVSQSFLRVHSVSVLSRRSFSQKPVYDMSENSKKAIQQAVDYCNKSFNYSPKWFANCDLLPFDYWLGLQKVVLFHSISENSDLKKIHDKER